MKNKLGVLAVAMILILGVTAFAQGARAGCGDPTKPLPSSALAWVHQADDDDDKGPATIVGLWHTHYTTADGSPFVESFKEWHSDKTEFENAFLPPAGGNICFGVWKEVGHLTVKLHHVGLMFNPDGSLKATFTQDEEDTVAEDNKTYTGKFDFKIFDLAGHQIVEVKGNVVARRITVD
jgi:hypothetical protein